MPRRVIAAALLLAVVGAIGCADADGDGAATGASVAPPPTITVTAPADGQRPSFGQVRDVAARFGVLASCPSTEDRPAPTDALPGAVEARDLVCGVGPALSWYRFDTPAHLEAALGALPLQDDPFLVSGTVLVLPDSRSVVTLTPTDAVDQRPLAGLAEAIRAACGCGEVREPPT